MCKRSIKKNPYWIIQKWKETDKANFINSIIALCTIIAIIYTCRTFNLTRQSIFYNNNNADTMLKELQKEFSIGNEPYLQYDFIIDDKHKTFYGSFTNYGKLPVQIIKIGFLGDFKIIKEENIDTIKESRDCIRKMLPFDKPYITLHNTHEKYNDAKKDTIYIAGYCVYQILATGKYKKYKFEIKSKELNSRQYIIDTQFYIDKP